MDSTNYAQGLDIISETAKQYKDKRELYDKKSSEKKNIESRIGEIEGELENLSLLSVDDIKKNEIDRVEEDYRKKVNDANLLYENKISTIDSSAKNDVNVKKSIEQSYAVDINRAYAKVESAKKQVEECTAQLNRAQVKNEDLEQQIINSSTEESKIKLCALHIQPEYSNVKNNVDFQQDYRDPRGAAEKDAISKFTSLSAKKIKKIAQKMNAGRYVSSPDESHGLPIMEILSMVATTLWIAIKGIFKGIVFLYRPMSHIYDTTKKIVYGAVVSLILFLLVIFATTKFGYGIITILFLLLLVVLVVFIGMILYNVVKFSNKAFRKEQNLEYYTVGYYFTFREDEILFKIASNYYSELIEKNPGELDSLLNATFGTLQNQKDSAMLEVKTCNERLQVAQKQLTDEETTFQNEKTELDKKCKASVEETLAKLSSDRDAEKRKAKELLDSTLEDCNREKDALKNNAEKDAIEKSQRKKIEIESKREELNRTKEGLNEVNTELNQISTDVDDARIRNNSMVDELMNADIDTITDRKDGDKLPTKLNVGLCEEQYNNLCTNNIEYIYEKCDISASSDGWEPKIITCNIKDDGSNDVTKKYYSIIDSMISDILGKTYLNAFRFTIVDRQQSKAGVVNAMDKCGAQFDRLEEIDCIKLMLNERSDKCFEEIIKEQERLLNGKDINEVNQTEYKGSDNMVKHVFACVRLYKKLSDFNFKEFRRLIQTAKDNGIIPVFLMSSDYFNDVVEDLKGPMKDYCDNTYYVLDINSNKQPKVINLEQKKL